MIICNPVFLNPQIIYRPAYGRTGPISGTLFVDDFCIGTLTIGNGDMVNVGISVGVAVLPGTTPTVNTSAASGQPGCARHAEHILGGIGDGTGRIVFDHTASNYTFVPTLSGPGLVEVDAAL